MPDFVLCLPLVVLYVIRSALFNTILFFPFSYFSVTTIGTLSNSNTHTT
jgi:hypothetical protein